MGFGGIEQFDPSTSGGLHNLLTGGDYAPWNLLNSEGIGQNNFQATPYQTDPNAFRGQWNAKNSPYNPNRLANMAGQAGNAQAPGFAESQAGQSALAQLLMGQANGTAPSLAQQQLQQAQQTNAANTMGLMASQRGLNPGQGALNAANINANANQATAGQGVMAGLAERNAAQGQLGNVYNQMGGMGLQQQGQNNQMVQYYMGLGMSAQQAQLQASIAQQGMASNNYNAAQGLNAGVAAGNAQNNAQNAGAMFGAAGSLGGAILGALSGGGVVPGDPNCMPGYADGGTIGQAPLQPMGQGLTAALSQQGGVIPGADPGMDTVTDGRIGLRPGEVVVNPENPIYPAARQAVEQAPAQNNASALMEAIKRAFGVGDGATVTTRKRNTGNAAAGA